MKFHKKKNVYKAYFYLWTPGYITATIQGQNDVKHFGINWVQILLLFIASIIELQLWFSHVDLFKDKKFIFIFGYYRCFKTLFIFLNKEAANRVESVPFFFWTQTLYIRIVHWNTEQDADRFFFCSSGFHDPLKTLFQIS
jgi:hypothetical protein